MIEQLRQRWCVVGAHQQQLRSKLAEVIDERTVAANVADEVELVDKIEGLKWHLVAKTAGKGDLMLDEALAQLSPEDRAKVEAAAAKWLGAKPNSP